MRRLSPFCMHSDLSLNAKTNTECRSRSMASDLTTFRTDKAAFRFAKCVDLTWYAHITSGLPSFPFPPPSPAPSRHFLELIFFLVLIRRFGLTVSGSIGMEVIHAEGWFLCDSSDQFCENNAGKQLKCVRRAHANETLKKREKKNPFPVTDDSHPLIPWSYPDIRLSLSLSLSLSDV